MPWRETTDPYAIIVSELMLQQTQVQRVISKYIEWMRLFPTFKKLSQASNAQILTAWQGLGYNRRALYLKKMADTITHEYKGKIPEDLEILKGIGPNTAAAVYAYAFNKPVTFIETNIRTVYIHHFFKKEEKVSDKELIPLIQKTVDQKNPREWYWALMDYGTHLKQTVGNISTRSKSYTKQKAFKGSSRQTRASIVAYILKEEKTTEHNILKNIQSTHDVRKIITSLISEGFLKKTKKYITIS